MKVDFLVKLRDAAQLIADAANDELESMAPPDVKCDTKDFDALKWETKTGTKGDYEQTTKQGNDNNDVFQALQNTLKKKKGFCVLSDHKYWTHQGDFDVIDRRRK